MFGLVGPRGASGMPRLASSRDESALQCSFSYHLIGLAVTSAHLFDLKHLRPNFEDLGSTELVTSSPYSGIALDCHCEKSAREPAAWKCASHWFSTGTRLAGP